MPGDILAVLQQADKDCGFTSVLSQMTYPPKGRIDIPGNPEKSNYRRQTAPPGYDPSICDLVNGIHSLAEIAFIINGTDADNCYGNCATFEAAYSYFADYSSRCFNPYNINVDCNSPLYSDDAVTAYLNLAAVKAAIHVLAWIEHTECNTALLFDLSTHTQRSVPPAYFILPSLLSAGVKVHLWSGTLDYMLNPIGTELAIQNMTWNGAQGFTHKPVRRWYDNEGIYAGVYEVERGLGYCRFHGAGHRTSQDKPGAAFAFVQNQVVNDRESPDV